MKYLLALLLITSIIISCENKKETPSMDMLAEEYVRLVLEIGQYDSDFVDAYYGPEDWKPSGKKSDSLPSTEFISRTQKLIDQSNILDTASVDKGRLAMFKKQLRAVKTKLEMMGGKKYDFDTEANLIYDAQPPHYTQQFFEELIAELETIVPGEGDLSTDRKSVV